MILTIVFVDLKSDWALLYNKGHNYVYVQFCIYAYFLLKEKFLDPLNVKYCICKRNEKKCKVILPEKTVW